MLHGCWPEAPISRLSKILFYRYWIVCKPHERLQLTDAGRPDRGLCITMRIIHQGILWISSLIRPSTSPENRKPHNSQVPGLGLDFRLGLFPFRSVIVDLSHRRCSGDLDRRAPLPRTWLKNNVLCGRHRSEKCTVSLSSQNARSLEPSDKTYRIAAMKLPANSSNPCVSEVRHAATKEPGKRQDWLFALYYEKGGKFIQGIAQ